MDLKQSFCYVILLYIHVKPIPHYALKTKLLGSVYLSFAENVFPHSAQPRKQKDTHSIYNLNRQHQDSGVTNKHTHFTTHIYMSHIAFVSLHRLARLLHWLFS